jgi:hypothetical protein
MPSGNAGRSRKLGSRTDDWPVSNIEQPANSFPCNGLLIETAIQILAVELDGVDGIMVTFSDGTTAGYVVEELLD